MRFFDFELNEQNSNDTEFLFQLFVENEWYNHINLKMQQGLCFVETTLNLSNKHKIDLVSFSISELYKKLTNLPQDKIDKMFVYVTNTHISTEFFINSKKMETKKILNK